MSWHMTSPEDGGGAGRAPGRVSPGRRLRGGGGGVGFANAELQLQLGNQEENRVSGKKSS
jgi:hypothetical protein